MVYHNLKAVFPHIVKTGGSTLEYHLGQVSEPHMFEKHKNDKNKMGFLNAVYTKNKIEKVKGRGNIHRSAKDYLKFLGKDYYDYYSFSIVRNPFSQIKSLYSMNKEFWTKKAKRSGLTHVNFPDWEEFIMEDNKKCLSKEKRFLDQMSLLSRDGEIIVKEIFPFEYYSDVMKRLGRKFGFRFEPKIKMWSTKPENDYTPEMCERVLDLYHDSYYLWKEVKVYWEKRKGPYKNGR